ncbi:hypothetical protein QYE76_040666 [Lolium multiflorum]|uniref:C3H1-type domain-containing protein n=1 Tax=Lolium multiflorum TaxID=4521 RepID=A0AAD8WVN6_LOLMU|nr:hypothetical protein QYE76_040666 [Lolium multiflorum]
MVPPRRPDVCRNFQHFGNFLFGSRCRFLHSAPSQQRDNVTSNAPGKGLQAPWPSMQNPGWDQFRCAPVRYHARCSLAHLRIIMP